MDLLARREHSACELRAKLSARGFDDGRALDDELERLGAEGLLSDDRFAEAFVHARRLRGQGPLRIVAELRERGVAPPAIAACIDPRDDQWRELARAARRKRFGREIPQGLHERAQQARFLRYRGFAEDQVRAALGGGDDP